MKNWADAYHLQYDLQYDKVMLAYKRIDVEQTHGFAVTITVASNNSDPLTVLDGGTLSVSVQSHTFQDRNLGY